MGVRLQDDRSRNARGVGTRDVFPSFQIRSIEEPAVAAPAARQSASVARITREQRSGGGIGSSLSTCRAGPGSPERSMVGAVSLELVSAANSLMNREILLRNREFGGGTAIGMPWAPHLSARSEKA
jgi:hypothetical protein